MSSVIIELSTHAEQTDFNERRWAEVLEDQELAKFPGRVETDRFGRIIMSPPPAPSHSYYEAEIAHILRTLLPHGRAFTYCAISTADGVKGADATWASRSVYELAGNRVFFPKAPEICVEVISPSNSEREIMEKAKLYFDAGAIEVWICDKFGKIRFFENSELRVMKESKFCPLFPTEIQPL